MKTYKKFYSIFVLLILLISIIGCKQYKGLYTFWRQNQSEVQKVEICSYDSYNKERTVIVELSNDDSEKMLNEISNMECFEYFPGDHTREYGPIMVCITYLDGEMELIGFTNIGYITSGGVSYMTPYSISNRQEFYDLICKYVSPELLPDISQEYPDWFNAPIDPD